MRLGWDGFDCGRERGGAAPSCTTGLGPTTVRSALGGISVFGSDIVPLNLVRNSNDGVALPTAGKLSPRVARRIAWPRRVRLLIRCCIHRWTVLSSVFNKRAFGTGQN